MVERVRADRHAQGRLARRRCRPRAHRLADLEERRLHPGGRQVVEQQVGVGPGAVVERERHTRGLGTVDRGRRLRARRRRRLPVLGVRLLDAPASIAQPRRRARAGQRHLDQATAGAGRPARRHEHGQVAGRVEAQVGQDRVVGRPRRRHRLRGRDRGERGTGGVRPGLGPDQVGPRPDDARGGVRVEGARDGGRELAGVGGRLGAHAQDRELLQLEHPAAQQLIARASLELLLLRGRPVTHRRVDRGRAREGRHRDLDRTLRVAAVEDLGRQPLDRVDARLQGGRRGCGARRRGRRDARRRRARRTRAACQDAHGQADDDRGQGTTHDSDPTGPRQDPPRPGASPRPDRPFRRLKGLASGRPRRPSRRS